MSDGDEARKPPSDMVCVPVDWQSGEQVFLAVVEAVNASEGGVEVWYDPYPNGHTLAPVGGENVDGSCLDGAELTRIVDGMGEWDRVLVYFELDQDAARFRAFLGDLSNA